ncbi:hypothetical protein FQR65_LT04707 [Abscondita terminalis]|nr:hypothetical protein FQR65_LT04707 [Abscondita terminalis]
MLIPFHYMAEKLEDFNLPISVVQRIVKESSLIAQKSNRKVLTGDDVFAALKNLDFEDLIEPLQKSLQEYKESCKKKDKTVGTSKAIEDDQVEEIEEIEDDNEDE